MDSAELVGDIANSLVECLMFSSLCVSDFSVDNVLADIYERSVLCASAMKDISKSCRGIICINIRKDEQMCVQLSTKESTMDDDVFGCG